MAGFADIGRCRVIDGFARCVHTIVTLGAIAGDARMREVRRDPGCCGVAGIAFGLCRDVGGGFADGCRAVVATAAHTNDFGMVHP